MALAAANADLAAAVEKLKGIQGKIKALEETLDKLTADFERATAEKLRCQEQADSTNRTIKYVVICRLMRVVRNEPRVHNQSR